MRQNTQTPRGRRGQRVSSPPEYYAYHDSTGPAKLSTTLAHALANVMGSDVTVAGGAISNCVSPDALDRLFSRSHEGHAAAQDHVAFSTEGHRVTVYNSRHIIITPPGNPYNNDYRTGR